MRLPFVHEMFAQVAERHPDLVAIESAHGGLTYRELHTRASLVAASIALAHVGRNDLVVIFGEDRQFIIESILGVMKAGAAFVPLSRGVPSKRLEAMLAQCSPKWAIVQPDLVHEFRPVAAAASLNIIPVDDVGASRNGTGHLQDFDGDDLSYIFFTSGSTGKPKAIAGRRKAIDHFIRWEIETFALGPGSRVSQLMSPMFDAFMRDIFAPLCSGGTVCIPEDDGGAPDGAKLGKWIGEAGINLVHTVPSMFRLILNQTNGSGLWSALQHVLLSGEPLLPTDVKKWYEVAGRDAGRLVNLYGPTETTMTKFVYMVEPADQLRKAIPIGKPMAGAKAVVVDKNGGVCPPWRVGELYIRTPYRSLGYFGQQELTNAVFVANPFNNDASDLVYKTGDLARIVDNGDFEVLGRRDNQVKIHGVRIEIEEIEAALAECEGVSQVAVAVRDDSEGDKGLVAYVVPEPGSQPTAASLRKSLKDKLPEYMLPAAWGMLQELPLTPTGKVDRQALEKIKPEFMHDGHQDGATLTQTEEILCGIWAQVLKADSVSAHDNFFEIGGHSLLATQLMSRIQDAFSLELPLRALFESPTVAELAANIEQVKQQKLGMELPSIIPVERAAPLPLSYAQQRLWFIDQLEPGGTSYNVHGAVEIDGPLDAQELKKSLQEIVRRHESLRTRFVAGEGGPQQVIDGEARIDLPVIDLSSLPANERELETKKLAHGTMLEPFDLTRGPLIRVKLLRLEAQRHVLLLVMHHIISDGWSIGLLEREVSALYGAFAAGQPSPLPELPIQYADYSVWQRKYLSSEVLEKKLEYWKQQLAGLETLELPTDRLRPAVKTTNGAAIALNFPADLAGKLKDLARQETATLYMVLLAAFQVLLFRYTDQADVAVGSPVAGRTRSETESLIGCFINNLVLRTDLSGDPAFTQLVQRAKEVTLEAFAHQDVPFEKLVETLQPERNLAMTPLFQVMFVLQNAPHSDLQFGAAKVRTLPIEISSTKFDLTLVLGETSSGMDGLLHYSTDLFETATIERMAGHFQTLLAAIVSGGAQRSISELTLLSEAERQQLLVEYNQTSRPWPADAYVHTLIEQQAALTPNAVAAEHEGRQLTYAELNSRSNQLAHYLVSLGVAPETRVGVYMERSAEMIIGLLAVLKAGGAYVPLDPGYPAERVGHMLEDGQVSVVLTRENLVNRLPSCGRVVNLDAEESVISSQSAGPVEAELCRKNLAYIIYTSGSTGKAKGVGVSHENLWISTLARTHYYSDPVTGYLLLSSFSFDSSVAGIFWTLIQGGALILPAEDVHGDAIGLAKLIVKTNASHLLALPALYELILESGTPLPSLKVAIVAGESCSTEVVASHRRNVPNTFLVNEYGPTEATVWCTAWTDHKEQLQWRIPIGQPIPGAKIYVLDRNLAPVPHGVVGELYVAGKGLTRGYVGHPDLTADRFIPNPFSEEPGERLYRTGDLVRWNANNDLEYLGRGDAQVKLRGFRIELGDIESVLRQHPAVEDVAVVLKDGKGGKRLVAYLVPVSSSVSSHSDLRKYLSQKLPDYMVPSTFVTLEKIPVTPNGKVDRKSLPEPDYESQAHGYIAPRDAIEQALCEVLQNLLGVERVGVDDNFFELGGHSLLATQVMSQVRTIFQVELALRVLFESPTVAGLAEQVRATRGGARRAEPSLVRVEPREDLPLSYAQQRLWFLDQLEPGSVAYNAPLGVRLEGTLDKEALRWSINEIIRRHEVLRTAFASRDGKAVQEIVAELQLQVEEIALSALAPASREEEAQRLAQAEVETPFDLAHAPLLRAKLLHLGDQDHVLLVTLHHIVSDGWSMGIIVREFMQLYQARAKGEESHLVQPFIQYADFAAWQRLWLQGELLEEQLGYWRNQLAELEPLNLPVDHRREAVLTRKGDFVPFQTTVELAQQLQRLSRQEGVTLFMALLAALQVTLSKHAGQQDIAVGTAVANRNRSEIEGLVGFFVNTLVMRTQLEPSWTFAQLLQQVRQVALDAYQHQDVPFERLVDELQPERDLSRSALFQVMLVLQNIRQEELQLPGLRLSGFAPAVEAPKFDLMLTLGESATSISGSLSYSSDLFERATVERLLEHLKLVLQAMVERPEQRIAELSLLTPDEQQTVLVEWNETTAEYPGKYAPELFAEQVARTPDAIAVRYEGTDLTYRELNAAANRIANALSKREIGPESLVGVCLDRSTEMVATLLGVLKAGAGYVPLDPNYPVERLRYMINDSKVALVLSSAPAIEKLNAIGCEAWKVEDLLSAEPGEASEVNTQVSGDHPAYVIYTSGSTGQPKGVVLTHASLQNHMAWMQQVHPLGPEDRVLQKTVFTFDASVWEFYAPLLAGGTLVMARPGGHQDPEYLVQCLQEEAITVLQLVPLQLRLMLGQKGLAQCHSLKRVYCGGEALTRDLVHDFYQQAPWVSLYNLYGPTEATIDATIGECSSTQVSDTAPIGKPISNTQVYVLGQGGEPVPVGTWGELYIGGTGLGRGYLHRPELTAENFVPNPFSVKTGERLYRTGDQVRWLHNGELEFLGRLDHQVKFRGHRLELGEIGAALLQHPDVEQAVVVIREDHGDRKLVAYFVAGGTDLSRPELRRYLQAVLPEYAVPSEFVQLAQLPLLPNGKINRQALPAPAIEQAEDETYVAPRTPVEEILSGIWAKLLNVERVGIHDNFFELGGDSILGIQVIAKAREAGVNLTARQMFEHQTIAELAELAGKQAIPADGALAIDNGLLDKTQRSEVHRLIKPDVKIEDIYPLSSMQQGMLFHSLYEPGSKVYLIQLMCHISGGMEPAAFHKAWEAVVQRHAILRTAVLWEGLEKPLQAVHGFVDLPWREEDWRDLSKAAQEENWQKFLREDQELGFDFQKTPLMRLALLRTGDESYYFAWTFHHVLIDGWCRQVLVKEVFSLYEAYREGRELELDAPPAYSNYIAWLQKQDESKAETFWREELKGFTSPTRLGIEQESVEQGVVQQSHGEATTHLPPELTRQLERFGKAGKITQNTIVQGAWALLLSRYSGEKDVLFGATVSGRSAPVAGIESMMGLFINTLPVRLSVDNDELTSEFLRRLQARQAEVREYEYSPLAKMQAWSEVRGMSLFNTLVVFENYPVDSVLRQRVAATITIDTLDLIDLSNYPLSLIVHPGEELVLSLAFDRAVFDQESVERLLKQFCTILGQMVSGNEQQLWQISLLGEDDRKQILVDWNRTDAALPPHGVQKIFEDRALQTPNAVAVEADGQKLTYRELNQRANQLARYLRARGVGTETLVGISVERSAAMVIGVLGILKAGGAYVPLDAAYPRERQEYMLKDTGAQVLLTQESLLGQLPEFDGQLICLDRDWEQISRESDVNPEAASSSDNLAYVMYTSGSTGRPKGIGIPQQAIVRLVINTNYVQLGPNDRIAQVASTSFDAATFEVWGALLNGACVVVLDRETSLNPAKLEQALRDGKITTMFLTTALFNQMARESKEVFGGLRYLLFGGEAVDRNRVEAVLQADKPQNFLHVYGPTEVTTYSTYYQIRELEKGTVPIGGPISNTEVYVLDDQMEPVPAGVAGELYAGGAGLARGYLNRAELTAEKFVPNPFGQKPGARLYRTGDRVRWRADGNIEFIGRQDNQVKMRGFRIELGEIEVALEQLPEVEQAAVLMKEDEFGNKHLVAYIVTQAPLTKAQLREALSQGLPQYMVPSNFVMLNSFPLSPNGKVDRKALPEPAVERGTDEASYVAPRNDVEAILCGIWAKLLKVERVGVHDNFFELGGDSILSIQVIGRAREAGVQLTPRQIFECQTIAELVEVAGVTASITAGADSVWSADPVPLTPIQAAFFQWKLPDPGYYNQGVMLELKPEVDSVLVKQVLGELLQQHEVLRMKYEQAEQGPLQLCKERASEDFYEYKDFSALEESDQKLVMELDADRAQASLDLEAGRLVAAVEYDLGPGKNKRLLLVIHHLVIDGVSWRILLADLERGYEQLKNGQSLSFGKTTSFRKWSEWVRQYSSEERLRQEMAYWCAEPRKKVRPLPKDLEVAGTQDATTEDLQTVVVSLAEEETRELLQEVPRVYHTQINDVLLTALGRVCAEWTGSRQVLVDLEGHGREEVLAGMDLSETVGWFTAIYPVLLEVEEDWEVSKALKQTKEQLRRVPNRGFGYGVLRYVAEDETIRRELAELPQSEISFNYLGQFDQVFRESKLFHPAQEGSGRSVSPENRRQHVVDVGGMVANGQLQIGWTYNANVTQRESIEKAAQQYVSCLREIIEHCRSEHVGGHTPSDFPLARLTQQQVDRVIGKGMGIEDVYGMSAMQQGLLFHGLYEAGSSMHFLQLACHIRKGIAPAAFRRAWEEVVRRHAILRTAFIWEGLEQSVQVVHERVEVPWLEQDWRDLPAAVQKDKWEKFLQEDREKGFDFRKAPLMRLALIRTGEESYYFVWSTHHILMDGWCRPPLIGEVFNVYKAYREGKEPAHKRVPAYREYIAWLQRQNEEKAEAFWRADLGGFSGSHELGIKLHKRELEKGEERFGEKRAGVGRELTERLEKLAREQQVTLNTVMLGAWARVLASYTGCPDVIFGTTVSGRPAELPGIESMIGLFINTLPTRVQIKSEETVASYLRRLQKRQVELRDYEYSPLPKVQAWSEMPRGVRLFESLFVFENYPAETAMEKQVDSSLQIDSVSNFDVTNYPISLVAVPGKDMVMVFKYDRTLFAHATIERVSDQLRIVLEQMAAAADQQVENISLLTQEQRQLLAKGWSGAGSDFSDQETVPQLVASHAEKAPQAAALIAAGKQLSYGELNHRANHLAHYLQGLGLTPGSRAAICLDEEVDLMVAMLGVLKTGAAFVIVKSDEPAIRTTGILEDADADIIITEQHLQHRFDGSASLVLMDAHQEELQRQSDRELNVPLDAGSLACLLYHSSPDGAPHGTLISHKSLRSATFAAELAIGIKDRVAQTLDLSLEGTCFEIFTALASGACIVSIPRPSLPPRRLAEFMREQRVTVLVTTSAVFTRLASQFPLALKKVRLIFIKDPLRLAGSLAQTLPSQTLERVYGAYGYSEAGGPSLLYPLKKLVDGGSIGTDSIAAGRRIYLLDRQLQPAPDGVLGEIYIGGEEVSLGYEKQPRRSAQTFVLDPFAKTPGTRMYRTGDWARRTEDGSLEFGPRTDGRLSISGQRVETKEVEIILEQHEGIREAAVMAQETSEGTIALSAVLVAESDYAIDHEELRAFAAERLPEWMVPLNFATVDAIPRTARGEVDAQALAARLRHKKNEGPRNQVEEILAEIWARLLKREQVGIHDNFFELGGDSILSIQVVTQAQDAGVHITPRQLFERPTIAELAEVAGTHSAETAADQGAITGPVPLTPIQTAFFEWDLAKPSHFNQAVLLDLTPGADSKHLENAVLALLQQHDVLRTRFTSGAKGWEQSIELEPPKEIYQRRDLSTLQEREQTAALESDANLTHASLDLQRGVLMRAVEYDLGSARGRRLLLVIHHLVVDGVSWRTLLTDLERAYEQLAQSQALNLGFKTTSYKRWSEALRQYTREEQIQQESAYWCSEVRKNVNVLPRDYSHVHDDSNTVDTLRSVTMTLETEETRELLQDIPSVYNTQINDVLLTVAGQVFGEWTGSGHVLVDLEGHGREELSAGIDLSRTVGWFTALYPVLLAATPTGQWGPGEALSTTKEQLRAVPNRGLGYGLLRYLSEDEETRRQFQQMPKAEIIFNYLGQLDALIGEPRLFKLALENSGKAAAGENRRAYVLDVNAMVVQGKLQVNWGYSDKLHRRETIETLARRYMQCLRDVIAHCRKEEAGGFTPSDFPAANNMTQDELMQIGALLGK